MAVKMPSAPQCSKWPGLLAMVSGLLIAAFATPSRGVSPFVLYVACLPFILCGMASALHCRGGTGRTAYAVFLSAITILIFATAYGFEPGERACKEWAHSLESPAASAESCKWVAAAFFGILWLALGTALFVYLFKPEPAER